MWGMRLLRGVVKGEGGREGGGTQRMLGVDITYNGEGQGRGLRLALKRNMIVFRALSCGNFCSNEVYKP